MVRIYPMQIGCHESGGPKLDYESGCPLKGFHAVIRSILLVRFLDIHWRHQFYSSDPKLKQIIFWKIEIAFGFALAHNRPDQNASDTRGLDRPKPLIQTGHLCKLAKTRPTDLTGLIDRYNWTGRRWPRSTQAEFILGFWPVQEAPDSTQQWWCHHYVDETSRLAWVTTQHV